VHSSIRSLRSPLGTEFVLSVPTIPLSTDTTWVLLHGTDGHETDLLPLADRLAPDDAKIALRGTEPTAQGWAHFRRRPDRTLDEDDLRARIALLTDAIDHGQAEVGPTARRVVLGFSNGAIAAAALLELRPDLFTAGGLIRPQPPFRSEPVVTDSGVPALVLDARFDTRRAADDGRRTAERLRATGAVVDHVTLPVHHGITARDEDETRRWWGGVAVTS
jgi:phospholipase/carboxylesterase